MADYERGLFWTKLYSYFLLPVGSEKIPPSALQPFEALFVLNPALVPPLISRGAPRQTAWETSISERSEKWPVKFSQTIRLPCNCWVLLHAANLRHWTDGFTSPLKGSHAEDFSVRKIRRLRPSLNPRSWVPEASMLITRPPKPLRHDVDITGSNPAVRVNRHQSFLCCPVLTAQIWVTSAGCLQSVLPSHCATNHRSTINCAQNYKKKDSNWRKHWLHLKRSFLLYETVFSTVQVTSRVAICCCSLMILQQMLHSHVIRDFVHALWGLL
jgi:hypothetical protein